MRIALYILLIFSLSVASADELLLVDGAITEYPERNISFYQFDASSKSALNTLDESNLEVLFNNQEISSFSLIPANYDNYTKLSIIFSIDVSGNAFDNVEQIKSSINKVFQYLSPYEHSFAIQTYNSQSYLLQDLTEDYNKRNRALNMLSPFGVTNYNTGFLNSTTGSIDLAEQSEHKPIIININSSNGFGDSTSIITAANGANVPIYNFSLIENPKVLSSISANTNGSSYGNLDSDGLFRMILYSVLTESNIRPYNLVFNSESCDKNAEVNLEKIGGLEKDDFMVAFDTFKLPYIEVDPLTINFGLIEANNSDTKSFTLTAKNSDITLEDILVTAEVQITPDYKNIVLEKNSPKAFNLELSVTDTNYNYLLLDIISNSCISNSIEVYSGSKVGSSTETSLKVEYPNGSEVFNQGEEISLEWSGVPYEQNIILEYSTDNGSEWELISDSAVNKSYQWNTPDIESDEMLLKASIPNGDISYSGIDYLTSPTNSSEIIQVDLSNDKTFGAMSYENGGIVLWDLQNDEEFRILRNENPGITNLDISYGFSSNLFAAAFGKEDDYNVVIWDPNNDDNTLFQNFSNKPNVLEWANNSSILLIGFDDGELIEWDISKQNDELTSIFNSDKPINLIDINRTSENIIFSNSQSVYVINKEYEVLDSLLLLGSIDIKWNNSGSKFSVAYGSEDLRIYNFSNSSISLNGRINRNDTEKILQSRWIDNSKILISTKNSFFESWNSNDSFNQNYLVHELPLNSFEINGTSVISADESNTAIYWNLDDYPFDFSIIDSDVSDANWSIVNNQLKLKEPDFSYCIGNEYFEIVEDAITNDGNTKVKIDSIKSDYQLFKILNTFPIELEPSESIDLKFSFAPVDIGNFVNDFYIHRGGRIDTLTITYDNSQISLANELEQVQFESTIINLSNTKTFKIFKNDDNRAIQFDTLEILIGDDVFEYVSGNYDNIAPGENLELELSFTPTDEETYGGLIKLTSSDICFPYYISIMGRGIDSDIRILEKVEFGNFGCDATADTTVMLYNLSDADIEIESFDFTDGTNFSSSNSSTSVRAKDSLEINIQFSPNSIGIFTDTLNIGTNLSGKDAKLKVAVSGTRDTTDILFVDMPLEFGTIRPNTSEVETSKIVNNSQSDLELNVPIDLGLFELIAANPETVAPGDTAELSFRFKGYENDTTFTTNFPILQGCESVFEQELSVNVSNGPALIEVTDELDMGVWNCKDSLIRSINIKNIGESNLILNDLYFETDQATQFKLMQNYTSSVILPENDIEIEFIYYPDAIGDITTNLVVESNGLNTDNGKNEIAISVEQNNVDFSLSTDSLIFDGLKSNTAYTKTITIYNDGNIEIEFSFVNSPLFVLNANTPITIPSQDSVVIEVEFTGGEKDNTYTEQIEFINECNQLTRLILKANVVGDDFMTLRLDSYELETSTEFNLDISYINSTGVEITDNDTITTTLSFNSTLMVPLNDNYKSSIDSAGNRNMT